MTASRRWTPGPRPGLYTRPILLGALILAYIGTASYNLGLPGLHYDEAKEAGLNALELLRGEPVTAFRDASVSLGGRAFPIMVQDYIGALNVYLVLPFLALTGVGVPNLRWPAILIGVATLLLLERVISEWWTLHHTDATLRTSVWPRITSAGLLGVAFLALSPSFVFWSRQGIFVTNLTQPLCLLAIWQGLRWLRWGGQGRFLLTGLFSGLALYAKLLAGWLLAPFAALALLAYVRSGSYMHGARQVQPDAETRPRLTVSLLVLGVVAFVAGFSPLLLFNLQTGGTLVQLGDNLGQSYYGVDNRAWAENLAVRLRQVLQTLRGDHFWYLGGLYANGPAPWLAGMGVMGVLRRPALVGIPLLLAAAGVSFSIFTISDLFITHFALLQPALVAVAAIGWTTIATSIAPRIAPRIATLIGATRDLMQTPSVPSIAPLSDVPLSGAPSPPTPAQETPVARTILLLVALLWITLDSHATIRYHAALAQSGGLADHSDATYHLAYYLRYNGMGAPLALDWGMDAPVRFLSENTVRPIEIFGYGSPAVPDEDFPNRLALFLGNPDNVYLLRSPTHTVFAGRREVFFRQVATRGQSAVHLETFAQRDGTALFELWRVQ